MDIAVRPWSYAPSPPSTRGLGFLHGVLRVLDATRCCVLIPPGLLVPGPPGLLVLIPPGLQVFILPGLQVLGPPLRAAADGPQVPVSSPHIPALVQMSGCSNVQMSRCRYDQMSSSPEVQMSSHTEVQISSSPEVQMSSSPAVPLTCRPVARCFPPPVPW